VSKYASAFVGIGLVCALAAQPVRTSLEAAMITHMLVQLPLLALAGALLAFPFRTRLQGLLGRIDPSGIASALLAVLASSYWMLPRALDAALTDPVAETAKILSLPLLVGVTVLGCRKRLSTIATGFFIANVLSMWAAAGWLYRVSPVRLCNSYLIEDQIRAGDALLWISIALALLWLSSFFFGAPSKASRFAVSVTSR
jgi:hypothetical protein